MGGWVPPVFLDSQSFESHHHNFAFFWTLLYTIVFDVHVLRLASIF